VKAVSRIIALGLLALALPLLATAATAGTWVAYPGQQTVYQTQVNQPINADGSSVFANNSKSVIPVKFSLLSGLGEFKFESIYSDNTSFDDGGGACGTGSGADHANDCAFLSFTPSSTTTFNQITDLVANYTFTLGDCHGGALRWSVRTSPTQSVFIYYGAFPQFGNGGVNGCTPTSPLGVNQSGTNMIGLSDLRYDTSQYAGGTFYDSYAHAQTLVGNTPILRASLVLDAGWAGDQRVRLDSATVNGNTFTPAPATPLKSTCKLPPADIRVTKVSVDPPSVVNEPISIQPADVNGHFRIVDCKYMYNLATSSLSGTGRYKVEAVIDGNAADGAAYFSLQ
jgi:hypothetical protein